MSLPLAARALSFSAVLLLCLSSCLSFTGWGKREIESKRRGAEAADCDQTSSCPPKPNPPPLPSPTVARDFRASELCGGNLIASERLKHTQSCETLGETYGELTLDVRCREEKARPAEQHADLNIFLRGFDCLSSQPAPAQYPARDQTPQLALLEWDPLAPRIQTMFERGKDIRFGNLYASCNWDWQANAKDGARLPGLTGKVDLAGIQTLAGELVRVPSSGYNLGEGYEVIVLFASANSITLKYTRDDNIVCGYGLHVTGICVDPNLLAMYERLKTSATRPALRARQAFARALGQEVQVAIRDTGSFMDVTSRHNWFQEDRFD